MRRLINKRPLKLVFCLLNSAKCMQPFDSIQSASHTLFDYCKRKLDCFDYHNGENSCIILESYSLVIMGITGVLSTNYGLLLPIVTILALYLHQKDKTFNMTISSFTCLLMYFHILSLSCLFKYYEGTLVFSFNIISNICISNNKGHIIMLAIQILQSIIILILLASKCYFFPSFLSYIFGMLIRNEVRIVIGILLCKMLLLGRRLTWIIFCTK